MQEARTWRELLGHIISDSKEKQRLIDALNITPTTLTRWVIGESEPRPQKLQQLIQEIPPHYQGQMRDFVRDEKGEKHSGTSIIEVPTQTIPSEFYARVLAAHTSTISNLRFWSTSHLILQQAIWQLDPEHRGLSIWIVRCMPPSGPFNKVRSLRESVGVGTAPWHANLEQNALFLGAESLAGNVITQCRPGIIQNIEKEHNLIPAARNEYEKSAAIYPILYAGRIAGVLLVSSTQIDYFQSPNRTELVQSYANLAALAFKPEDFYRPEKIALGVMPAQAEQKLHFVHFRQMVEQIIMMAAKNNQRINKQQADMLVWEQLEEKLLQIQMTRQSS